MAYSEEALHFEAAFYENRTKSAGQEYCEADEKDAWMAEREEGEIRMMRRCLLAFAIAAGVTLAGEISSASAQQPSLPNLPRFSYYPYYYFPASYWPQMSPQWPEPPGAPYQRPPAYMAYPPFKEPNWRYELWAPKKYYRGNHFWLDSF